MTGDEMVFLTREEWLDLRAAWAYGKGRRLKDPTAEVSIPPTDSTDAPS